MVDVLLALMTMWCLETSDSNDPLRQRRVPPEREPQLHLYENLRLANYVSLCSSLSRTLRYGNDKNVYFEEIRKLFSYLSYLHFDIYL